jgi:hypothetical protein
MYSVRTLPLAAPLAAGIWMDGTPGAVLLSVAGVVALLLAGRHTHQHLRNALDAAPAGRHGSTSR